MKSTESRKTEKRKYGACAGILIYLYLSLPTLIFLTGWLKWYFALPFAALTAFACVRAFSDSVQERCFVLGGCNAGTFLKAALLISLWVYLSGIGGWCYQNSDHEVRNAIFRALVEYDWPVVSHGGDRGLVYYIGFWLPAACVGKVCGLEAGYAAQFMWAVAGIFIVYYLICIYRGKADLLPLLFLVFFSGLDYAGTWILGEEGTDLRLASHLEWWAADFQFTSMTAQLFWVFNQAVPAWVATAAVLVQKNGKNMLFLLAVTMLSATIPFVGLIPIVLYLYAGRIRADRKNAKELLTFQNVVGVFVVGICMFLYLSGNISGGMIEKDNAHLVLQEPAAGWLRYFLFYFLEFGVYLYFLYRYRKSDSLIWFVTVLLLVCPFIKVGEGHDFCMRASVPALFVLMLRCMETWEGAWTDVCAESGSRECADKVTGVRTAGKKYLFAAYCAVLLLGAVTPFNEIHRSVRETFWRVTYGQSVRYPEIRIEGQLLRYGNFSGDVQGSFFYRYLADVHGVN